MGKINRYKLIRLIATIIEVAGVVVLVIRYLG
jgi:hypothetical protein